MKSEIIFGLHAVQSALKSAPQKIKLLKVLSGRNDQKFKKILNAAKQEGVQIEFVSRKDLDALVDGNHQGVVAYAEPGERYDETYLYQLIDNAENVPFLLILDGVTDPHNLGACLRSADAAGVQAVIVPKDNSVGLTEVARKVACGAAEVVPLIPVTNLARTMKNIQERGVWVVGLAGEAEQSIYETSLTGPLAVVMGAEGKGMRRLTKENCDYLALIPMVGSVSSLNVSVATGVSLFEALRQRQ